MKELLKKKKSNNDLVWKEISFYYIPMKTAFHFEKYYEQIGFF